MNFIDDVAQRAVFRFPRYIDSKEVEETFLQLQEKIEDSDVSYEYKVSGRVQKRPAHTTQFIEHFVGDLSARVMIPNGGILDISYLDFFDEYPDKFSGVRLVPDPHEGSKEIPEESFALFDKIRKYYEDYFSENPK